jgi:hypothetical protein
MSRRRRVAQLMLVLLRVRVAQLWLPVQALAVAAGGWTIDPAARCQPVIEDDRQEIRRCPALCCGGPDQTFREFWL